MHILDDNVISTTRYKDDSSGTSNSNTMLSTTDERKDNEMRAKLISSEYTAERDKLDMMMKIQQVR